MVTYTSAIIHIGTQELEEVEVLIECYMDGKFRADVQGMNPYMRLGAWVCEPFVTQEIQAAFQKLVDENQQIQDDCKLAFHDAERMSA